MPDTIVNVADPSNADQGQGAAGGGEGGGGSPPPQGGPPPAPNAASAAIEAANVLTQYHTQGCGTAVFSDAVRAFQAAEGISVDGKYGPDTAKHAAKYLGANAPPNCPPGTPAPSGNNGATAVQKSGGSSGYQGFAGGSGGANAAAASALRIVAKDAGVTLSDTMLRILLGHALFESGYGRGDPAHNTLANTNNWGSCQVTPGFAQAHAGAEGFGGVVHQDSAPNHKSAANPFGTFLEWYAVFPNMVEGARFFFQTVKGALNEDIGTYSANLYHRGYYGGVSQDAQTNIDSYAKNIARCMPGSLTPDSPESVAAAREEKVGPFATAFDRMTAVFRVNGQSHGDTASASHAWDVAWSHPPAYTLGALDFAKMIAAGGVVWFGPEPKSYTPSQPSAAAKSLGAGTIIVSTLLGLVGLGWLAVKLTRS